ncbi:DUF6746 family protein [Natronohydrobacter thiooxidans]|uniref:DUF6746 family protein n=1 Tax=Natronohydrobacter thiooxidans TaxID=87172 RepID=UPI0008FF6E20|nr:DUF6746 family protein [Natronohydrobacter thiooxidans]
MKRRTALIVALAMGAMPVFAEERPDHYAAETSADLAEAMDNFSTHNKRMAEILAQPAMTPDHMEDIHQLTYTLEDALAKIITEATELAERLEEVHLASEGVDAAKLTGLASAYLARAQQLVP